MKTFYFLSAMIVMCVAGSHMVLGNFDGAHNGITTMFLLLILAKLHE